VVLILTKTPDSLSNQWKDREATIDFLLEHSLLNAVWKKIEKTVPVIESKQKSHRRVEDSQKFLKKLDSIVRPPKISKKDQHFQIDGKIIDTLSPKEFRLLARLYTKKNQYVSKDELLDLLYADDEGSDWSLAKRIER